MTAQQTSNITHPRNLSRRGFLAQTCLAASALRVHAATTNPPSKSTPPGVSEIDPGYVGPQFFDEKEQQALREVVESGSPFRYWGPGRPQKVQRFEEDFAKYMGTRFALGVTSGTASALTYTATFEAIT